MPATTATLETPRARTTHTSAPAHALASRYLDVEAMPWQPSQFPGIDIKVLYLTRRPAS